MVFGIYTMTKNIVFWIALSIVLMVISLCLNFLDINHLFMAFIPFVLMLISISIMVTIICKH